MDNRYKKTINACFVGYIIQAIVNNFAPLLFLTFQRQFNIPLSKITMLVTFNFLVQLVIDLLSTKFVDKIGYRISIVIAHVCVAIGLFSLAILPWVMSSSFAGLLISVCIYAVGGGLLEVLVSPIVEACPTDNKEIIFLLREYQEKPILQGLQRLWKVARCAGISMECNTYATSMQQIYQ